MHIWTHLKPESKGKTGLGVYPDGMVEHDGHVGQVLAKLKETRLDQNTIVMYSTTTVPDDERPDGGTTMFRGEEEHELGRRLRVPTLIRWPGVIKPARSSTTSARTRTWCRRCCGGRRHDGQGRPQEGPHDRA